MMYRHAPVVVLLAVAVLAPPLLRAASTAPASVWIVVALGLALALGRRRPRRALALGLALVLSVFAFEAGIHSIHHLGAGDGGRCPVATAAAQTSGTVVAPVDIVLAPVLVARSEALLDDHVPAWSTFAPDLGRAPPFLA